MRRGLSFGPRRKLGGEGGGDVKNKPQEYGDSASPLLALLSVTEDKGKHLRFQTSRREPVSRDSASPRQKWRVIKKSYMCLRCCPACFPNRPPPSHRAQIPSPLGTLSPDANRGFL